MSRVEAIFDLVDRMSEKLDDISRSSERAEDQIEDVSGAVNRLESRLAMFEQRRVEPEVGLQTNEFYRDLFLAEAALRRFETMNAEAGGRGGGEGVGGGFGVRVGPAGFGGGMAGLAIGSITATIPSALAAADALVVSITTLLPMLAAAGGGLAVMAGIGIPAIKGIAEGWEGVRKAEQAVREAKTPEQYVAAVEQLRLAQQALSPIQKDIIEDVKSLKVAWDDVTQGATTRFLEQTHGILMAVEPVLRRLSPIITAFADVGLDSMGGIEEFFRDPQRVALLERMLTPLPDLLRQMVGALARVGELLTIVTIAATPLASWILDGLNDELEQLLSLARGEGIDKLTKEFDSWRPVLSEVWALVKDIIGVLWELGEIGKDNFPELSKAIREALPVVRDLIAGFAELAFPVLTTLILGIAELDDLFGDATPLVLGLGAATIFLTTAMKANPVWLLVGGFAALLGLFREYPVVERMAAALAAVAAALILINRGGGLGGIFGGGGGKGGGRTSGPGGGGKGGKFGGLGGTVLLGSRGGLWGLAAALTGGALFEAATGSFDSTPSIPQDELMKAIRSGGKYDALETARARGAGGAGGSSGTLTKGGDIIFNGDVSITNEKEMKSFMGALQSAIREQSQEMVIPPSGGPAVGAAP